MSKKRIIIPNTKVDKNNIGKQGLRFDEIYADNIIVDKINNKKADPDYYLKDNFTIIYPNGGTKEKPANISPNSRYIEASPFPGYIINTQVEVYYNNQWGHTGWHTYYASGHYAIGVTSSQLNDDTIIIQTGNHPSHLVYVGYVTGGSFGDTYNYGDLPCRVKVWKVGKISDDD